MRTPVWTRPLYQAQDRNIAFEFACCSDRPIDLASGAPSENHGWCPLDAISDEVEIEIIEDPWPTSWGTEVFRRKYEADQMTAELAHALAATTHVYFMTVATQDADNFADLQCAWSVVLWLLDRGAFAVFDVEATRWWSRDDIVRWGEYRPFSFSNEVRLITRALTNGSRSLELTCTYGLQKLGRPNLLMTVASEIDEPIRQMWRYQFRSLADQLVLGVQAHVGQQIASEPKFLFNVLAYRDGVIPDELKPGSEVLVVLPEVG